MTVYVDPIKTYSGLEFSNPAAQRFGNKWCHMLADNIDELHEIALSIGLKKSYFQSKSILHYDLTPNKRALAISKGAVEITHKERSQMFKQLLQQGKEYRQYKEE